MIFYGRYMNTKTALYVNHTKLFLYAQCFFAHQYKVRIKRSYETGGGKAADKDFSIFVSLLLREEIYCTF